MHEMSLCESILQIVEAEAAREPFMRVTWLQLEIGALAGVEIDALRFCFEAVAPNTILAGAELDIVEPPGEARCVPCDKTVLLTDRYSCCPHCGAYGLQVTGGDQMRIKAMEVE